MERTNTKQCGNVVSKWKRKHSAFQNIKNLWNRCIIHEDRRIFVLNSVLETFHAYVKHTCMHMWYMHTHACIYHVCMHVYAWNVSKTDFNTKILLSSWIMFRFQRFLMFWKAECFLFHLETTFPRCFVFVCSKTWHLWKVCLIYWTNRGSSIPISDKYLSQNTGNTDISPARSGAFATTLY